MLAQQMAWKIVKHVYNVHVPNWPTSNCRANFIPTSAANVLIKTDTAWGSSRAAPDPHAGIAAQALMGLCLVCHFSSAVKPIAAVLAANHFVGQQLARA